MGKRKGYTLAETVIAMALTVLVVIAAISVVFTTVRLSNRIRQTQQAVQEVENILVCCQSGNIEAGLALLYGDAAISVQQDDFAVYYDRAGQYLGCGSVWNAAWKVQCSGDGAGRIQLKAVEIQENGTEGRVLYELEYRKAP